jgi:subfamily B ATP-binding cassette protein MsbA
MENKFDTFLGSGSVQISGVQKQRIAIARAILKNTSMFVFDEATSALERKNEKLIQSTLSQLFKNRTTLVIAHRLSTIRRADNIIVLNSGRVVEQGTHEELV